jgi:tRNA dimethylallyltransferase
VRDPAAALRIHPNDAQRIQRALEILAVSGRSLDEHWRDHTAGDFSSWTICVLEPADRQRLHELLGQRFAAMLAAGMIEEVRRLLARGTLSDKSHTLRLVGYRQLLSHIAGAEDLDTAAAKAIAATRQLAKRQLTWLRSENLLPYGATVMRGDPFDETTQEIFMRALIEAGTPA